MLPLIAASIDAIHPRVLNPDPEAAIVVAVALVSTCGVHLVIWLSAFGNLGPHIGEGRGPGGLERLCWFVGLGS